MEVVSISLLLSVSDENGERVLFEYKTYWESGEFEYSTACGMDTSKGTFKGVGGCDHQECALEAARRDMPAGPLTTLVGLIFLGVVLYYSLWFLIILLPVILILLAIGFLYSLTPGYNPAEYRKGKEAVRELEEFIAAGTVNGRFASIVEHRHEKFGQPAIPL